jgi:hypothetical protein
MAIVFQEGVLVLDAFGIVFVAVLTGVFVLGSDDGLVGEELKGVGSYNWGFGV